MLRRRAPSIGSVAALAAAIFAVAVAGSSAARAPLRTVTLAPPPGLRAPGTVSEPHLAIDPAHPSVLVAVAQTRDLVAWRSEDGGRSWRASPPVAGKSSRRGYGAGDPVVALGADGSARLGGVVFNTQGGCTLLNRVGSYRSGNGGRNFRALAEAGQTQRLPRRFFGVPPVPNCPLPPGLTHVATNDKPWLAVDSSTGPRRGWVYLAWTVNDQYPDGRTFSTLLFAASRNGGRTYGRPVVVAPRARAPDELEQYSQVAVRPDGTIDIVWNARRSGATVILHSASRNGGASFGAPERVTTRPRGTTPLGLASSLAVSPTGRLAVCWAGSIRAKAYVPRVACSLSDGNRVWSRPVSPLANAGPQYLPAAAFQDERLWVAAYRSTAETTRVLPTRSDDGRSFAQPVVLATRPYGRSVICAPHPPDCGPRQRFVGDYIGAVASSDAVSVAFVLPVGLPASPNRVFVATLEQP
jgi:hypothetical protein